MNKTVRVGVIGAGNMGRHHARNINNLQGAELVAIADPDNCAQIIAKENETNFYLDYLHMVEAEQPDAVTIAAPTPVHFKIASAMIERGIHTIVEKPIAETVEQGRELGRLALKQEVIFTVGHIERFNPLVQEIGSIICNEEIGKISSIVTTRIGGLPSVKPNTDVISDLAIHDIDIMHFLLKQPLEVVGAHGSQTYHSDEIDSAEILLSANGTSGFIQANWITPTKIREIRITGEGGFLKGNFITQDLEFLKTTLTDSTEDFSVFVEKLGTPQIVEREIEKQEPLKAELANFIRAVAKSDSSGLMTADEAILALDLALKAKKDILYRINKE